MKEARILFLLIWTITFCSCSTVRLTNRNGKDKQLDVTSFDKLNGNYSNFTLDTNHINRTLFNNFKYDSVYKQKNLIVALTTIDKKTISLKLLDNGKFVDSVTIKGNYRNGYFKIRRQWNTSFIAGPLLWILGDNLKYLGLTNENNLVIVNSGGGGVMLLIAIPVFAAGSGQFENEYVRAKSDKKITGYYAGSWARTSWEYKFYDNNTFWFKSSGHFGNMFSSGQYSINQDTLVLNSFATDTIKKKVFYNFKGDKYLIDGDSCIVDLQTGYDYCKIQTPVDINIWMVRASRQRLKK